MTDQNTNNPQPTNDSPDTLKDKVLQAIQTVYDPEIPINIYELGLIYKVEIDTAARKAEVLMTLTTPHCPEAASMPGRVERAATSVDGIDGAHVELTWEPAWNPQMMSEAAKLQLGFM